MVVVLCRKVKGEANTWVQCRGIRSGICAPVRVVKTLIGLGWPLVGVQLRWWCPNRRCSRPFRLNCLRIDRCLRR